MISELFPKSSQPAGKGSQAEQSEVFLVPLRVACVSHDRGSFDDERAEEGRATDEACDATKADGDTFGPADRLVASGVAKATNTLVVWHGYPTRFGGQTLGYATAM